MGQAFSGPNTIPWLMDNDKLRLWRNSPHLYIISSMFNQSLFQLSSLITLSTCKYLDYSICLYYSWLVCLYILIISSTFKCPLLITKYSIQFTEFYEPTSFRVSSRKGDLNITALWQVDSISQHLSTVRINPTQTFLCFFSDNFYHFWKLEFDYTLLRSPLQRTIDLNLGSRFEFNGKRISWLLNTASCFAL